MNKIAPAFIAAKRAFAPLLKDKTNPAFRSKYADLGACIDAVEDALLANDIAFFHESSEDATGVTVECVLIHASGETIRGGKLHVPASKQDPQGYGSALTYARRYSLTALCGIAPEDDDGNAASGRVGATNSTSAVAAKSRAPVDPVREIEEGVKKGDASGAASYLAGLDDKTLDAIWSKLTEKTQDALRKAWPATKEAA